MLDLPSPESFIYANVIAHDLGFLKTQDDGSYFTPLGEKAASISRINMESIKMLFSGFLYNCAMYDLITLTTIVQENTTINELFAGKMKNAKFGELPPDARPLSVSVPSCIASRSYIGGSDEKTYTPVAHDEEFYYRLKLLVADQYIELIMIFDAFMKAFTESVQAAEVWCGTAGLDFDSMVNFMKARGAITAELTDNLDINYNMEYRLFSQPMSNMSNTLTALKRCLYEGYKNRLFTLNEKNLSYSEYVNVQGQVISIKPLFTEVCMKKMQLSGIIVDQFKPFKYVLTTNLLVTNEKSKELTDPIKYQIKPANISILDGII